MSFPLTRLSSFVWWPLSAISSSSVPSASSIPQGQFSLSVNKKPTPVTSNYVSVPRSTAPGSILSLARAL